MVKLSKIVASLLFSVAWINTTVGQYNSIPSTPYEARIWLEKGGNSFEENDLGQVESVTISYVPRIFVVGDLGIFPKLERLTISRSGRFYDRHMSGIARLSGLKRLSIRRCDKISGASLDVLRYLPQLEELELINVESLYSLAPLTLCKSLKKLSISENDQFDFRGLSKVVGIVGLRELVLESNGSLDDSIISCLGSAKTLTKLSLRGNKGITDRGMSFLPAMEKLKFLDLSKCPQITGVSLCGVRSDLETLLLDEAGITDAGVKCLAKLRRIKILQLNKNPGITRESLLSLAGCENLERLNLSGLPVSTSLFESMSHFKELKSLNLAGCRNVTGTDIGQFSQCNDLEELDLSGCRRIDSSDLIPLKQFKHLKTLILDRTRVKTDGIGFLESLGNLETVSLSGCKWIDDHSIKALANISSLKVVYLNDISRLTDTSLRYLGDLPVLEELYLSRNRKITGRGFDGFDKASPLRILKLDELDSLTPEGMRQLARLLNLELLSIRCKGLTNEHLLAMMGLPRLTKFDLNDTSGVDSNVYRKWVNSLPNYPR